MELENEGKIYINGTFLREITFDNGGTMIKVDIPNATEFGSQLQKHANGDGKITLEIKRRMNKSESGITHYIEVSRFVPKQKVENQNVENQQVVNNPIEKDDGMPF